MPEKAIIDTSVLIALERINPFTRVVLEVVRSDIYE